MIPDKNPFRPSFGISPLQLAGRDESVQAFRYGLYGGIGSMSRHMLISGSRGFGKTVLLNEFEEEAQRLGWVVLRAHANEELLAELRVSTIPGAQRMLDSTGTKTTLKGVNIAGLGGIEFETESSAMAMVPSLTQSLRQLAQQAQRHEAGVLITLDEIQAAPVEDLAKLATAVQDLVRDELDISFVAAGLTQGIDALLRHPGTTFMRRAHRVDLSIVPDDDVKRALKLTAQEGGRDFAADALECAAAMIHGYPYLIQLVGSLAWTRCSLADESMIALDHVEPLHKDITLYMGNQVHAVAIRDLPTGEVNFLRAMAQTISSDQDEVSTTEIAELLNKDPRGISVWRKNLISKDLIQPGTYGAVRFTLPYMAEYLQSAQY